MKKLNTKLREGDFSRISPRVSVILVLQTCHYFPSLGLTCVKWSNKIQVGSGDGGVCGANFPEAVSALPFEVS